MRACVSQSACLPLSVRKVVQLLHDGRTGGCLGRGLGDGEPPTCTQARRHLECQKPTLNAKAKLLDVRQNNSPSCERPLDLALECLMQHVSIRSAFPVREGSRRRKKSDGQSRLEAAGGTSRKCMNLEETQPLELFDGFMVLDPELFTAYPTINISCMGGKCKFIIFYPGMLFKIRKHATHSVSP